MKFSFPSVRFWLAALLLGGAGLSGLGLPTMALAQAQSANSSQTANSTVRSTKPSSGFGGFFAPKGAAAPRVTEGGASRGRCLQDVGQDSQAIRLLTPAGNSGLTAASHPVFMAYVEQMAAHQIFFSIKNPDESYFYEMTMLLPQQSGIIKFQLPENAPGLTEGEEYLWSVALVCGNKLGPDSPWASGWIKRVAHSAPASTPGVSSLAEQASLYGKQGLWYDTARALADWRNQDAQPAATQAWRELLSSVGLTDLQDVPLSR